MIPVIRQAGLWRERRSIQGCWHVGQRSEAPRRELTDSAFRGQITIHMAGQVIL
jgi:hypothetical protein